MISSPLAQRAAYSRPRASSPAASPSKGAAWSVAALIGLVLVSGYLLTVNSPVDLYRRLLGLVVIWLGSVPTLVHLYNPRRPHIPFFPLVGMFYASNFGLPLFARNTAVSDTENLLRIEDVTPTSLWVAIAGIICLLVGFYAGQSVFSARIRGVRISGDWNSPRFRLILWVYLIIYFIYRAVPALRAIPSVGHVVDPLCYLGFGFFLISSLARRLSLLELVVVWGIMLPLELLFRLASGSVAEAMIFGLFFSLIALRTAPKLAVGAFVFAIITFAIFNPVKPVYRAITWYSSETGNGSLSTYEKCNLLVQLAYEYHFGSLSSLKNGDQNNEMVTSLASRLSSITVLSLVMNETPSHIPYWAGWSYLPLFTKVIPRFLWPEKPVDDMGNQFGHRYFLLGDNDQATSLNLPWIVEMYANFGAWGVYIGMLVVGLGLSWLDRVINRPHCKPIELIFGVTLVLQLIYEDSSFSLMIGNAVLTFIIAYLALRIGLPALPVYRQRPVSAR